MPPNFGESMKLFLLLAMLLTPLQGFSARSAADVRFLLNHGYGAVPQLGMWEIDKKEQVFHGQWSYARDGGASGSITLKDVDGKAGSLPAGAIVTDCILDVLVAPLSGNTYYPKIAIGTGATTQDLKLVTTTASYTVSEMACIPVGSAATAIKLAAAVTPVLYAATVSVVPTASLTAGKIDVFIKYLIGN